MRGDPSKRLTVLSDAERVALYTLKINHRLLCSISKPDAVVRMRKPF